MTKTWWLVIVGKLSFVVEVQETDALVDQARTRYLATRGAPVEPKSPERAAVEALVQGIEEPENIHFIRVPRDFDMTWDNVTWGFEDFLAGDIPLQLMQDRRDRPDR